LSVLGGSRSIGRARLRGRLGGARLAPLPATAAGGVRWRFVSSKTLLSRSLHHTLRHKTPTTMTSSSSHRLGLLFARLRVASASSSSSAPRHHLGATGTTTIDSATIAAACASSRPWTAASGATALSQYRAHATFTRSEQCGSSRDDKFQQSQHQEDEHHRHHHHQQQQQHQEHRPFSSTSDRDPSCSAAAAA